MREQSQPTPTAATVAAEADKKHKSLFGSILGGVESVAGDVGHAVSDAAHLRNPLDDLAHAGGTVAGGLMDVVNTPYQKVGRPLLGIATGALNQERTLGLDGQYTRSSKNMAGIGGIGDWLKGVGEGLEHPGRAATAFDESLAGTPKWAQPLVRTAADPLSYVGEGAANALIRGASPYARVGRALLDSGGGRVVLGANYGAAGAQELATKAGIPDEYAGAIGLAGGLLGGGAGALSGRVRPGELAGRARQGFEGALGEEAPVMGATAGGTHPPEGPVMSASWSPGTQAAMTPEQSLTLHREILADPEMVTGTPGGRRLRLLDDAGIQNEVVTPEKLSTYEGGGEASMYVRVYKPEDADYAAALLGKAYDQHAIGINYPDVSAGDAVGGLRLPMVGITPEQQLQMAPVFSKYGLDVDQPIGGDALIFPNYGGIDEGEHAQRVLDALNELGLSKEGLAGYSGNSKLVDEADYDRIIAGQSTKRAGETGGAGDSNGLAGRSDIQARLDSQAAAYTRHVTNVLNDTFADSPRPDSAYLTGAGGGGRFQDVLKSAYGGTPLRTAVNTGAGAAYGATHDENGNPLAGALEGGLAGLARSLGVNPRVLEAALKTARRQRERLAARGEAGVARGEAGTHRSDGRVRLSAWTWVFRRQSASARSGGSRQSTSARSGRSRQSTSARSGRSRQSPTMSPHLLDDERGSRELERL